MTVLPEPPAAPVAGQAARDAAIEAAADQMLTALNSAITREKQKTSYRDDDLPSHKDGPQIGTTPPVPQPDSRIVPAWALGLAVGSVGVGAGVTGLGCGFWLACKGLSMVSLPSLQTFVWIIVAPFAGAAMLATAIGGAISKAKKAALPDIHHHNGPEYHEHTTTNTRSVWSKTVNKR